MPDTFLASNLALRLIPDSPPSSSRAKNRKMEGAETSSFPVRVQAVEERERLCVRRYVLQYVQ